MRNRSNDEIIRTPRDGKASTVKDREFGDETNNSENNQVRQYLQMLDIVGHFI